MNSSRKRLPVSWRSLNYVLREMERRRLKGDFSAWAKEYLAAYFALPDSSFHRWLGAELNQLHDHRGTRINVVAPRGSAKSTWAAEAYPLYCAVEGIEPYIVITSDTGPQAEKRLEMIRTE